MNSQPAEAKSGVALPAVSTVDELREALAYYPGHMPVMLMVVVDGDPDTSVPLSSIAVWTEHDGDWCALVGSVWDNESEQR